MDTLQRQEDKKSNKKKKQAVILTTKRDIGTECKTLFILSVRQSTASDAMATVSVEKTSFC